MIEMKVMPEDGVEEGLTLAFQEKKAVMRFWLDGEDHNDSIYVEVPIDYEQLLEGGCKLKSNKPYTFGNEEDIACMIPTGESKYLVNMLSPDQIGSNIHGLRVEINEQLLDEVIKHAEEKTRSIKSSSQFRLDDTTIEQILGAKVEDSGLIITDLKEQSGLPLVLIQVESGYILAIKQNNTRFLALQPDIKRVRDMEAVAYPAEDDLDKIVYQVYKNIHKPEDEGKIIVNGIRYDIAVIAPGNIGFQKNKTYGHYHPSIAKVLNSITQKNLRRIVQDLTSSPNNIDRLTTQLYSMLSELKPTNDTFLELCQVIKGTALYLIQLVEGDTVKDVVEVKCKTGDLIIVPNNYGHVTINETNEAVITANWVANFFTPQYSEFTSKGGAAILYMASGDTAQNPKYRNNVQYARVAKPRDFHYPLTHLDKPIYKLIENPTQLGFLLGK